jgi:hypothetical protein
MDHIQKKLINKKYTKFFNIVDKVYFSGESIKKIINSGIAFKISLQYNSLNRYVFSDVFEIQKKLRNIKFTSFFTGNSYSMHDPKKMFFFFKRPEAYFKMTAENPNQFIRATLRKYCSLTSSEKLYEIFITNIPAKISKEQEILKDAIYETAKIRASILNRMLSVFQDSKNKAEMKATIRLKRAIEQTNFSLSGSVDEGENFFDMSVVKSACRNE